MTKIEKTEKNEKPGNDGQPGNPGDPSPVDPATLTGRMLQQNKSFLRQRFPSILSKIQDAAISSGIPGSPETLELESAKNGLPTCRYRGRYCHSPRDPLKEAKSTLSSLRYAGQSSVILLSAGLGYNLSVLPESVKSVLLVENDPVLFEALCGTTDLAVFGERLRILVGPTDEEVSQALDGFLPANLDDLFVWEHLAVTDSDTTGFYSRVRGFIRTGLDRAISDLTTTGYFAPLWFANTVRNLKFLDGSIDLWAFKNAFARWPAAVVSAGPTLDETVRRLKPAADRVVIISAATAVRRLLAEGIRPHFVLSTDAGYYNSWHTRGLDLPDSILVADLSVNHLVPRTCGAKFAWIDFTLGFHDFLTKPDLDLPRFTMAGTVASSSVELASYLGCSGTWLFGQDFAFVSGRAHCRRTMHETYGLQRCGRTATLETAETRSVVMERLRADTDYTGKKILTSVKLGLYKDWFEKNYHGLAQTSARSAALRNAPLADLAAGRESVSEKIAGLSRRVRWRPGVNAAALLAESEIKLERSESPGEYLASLDGRLAAGIRTFVEFEMIRQSKRKPVESFPAPVRELVRRYIRKLQSCLEKL